VRFCGSIIAYGIPAGEIAIIKILLKHHFVRNILAHVGHEDQALVAEKLNQI
jgi:hypothetical protein